MAELRTESAPGVELSDSEHGGPITSEGGRVANLESERIGLVGAVTQSGGENENVGCSHSVDMVRLAWTDFA